MVVVVGCCFFVSSGGVCFGLLFMTLHVGDLN